MTAYTPNQARAIYDAAASTYDLATLYHQNDIQKLLDLVDPRPDINLLDLGCATGQLVIKAKKLTENGLVAGMDISPRMIDVATKNADQAGMRITFFKGDFTRPKQMEIVAKIFEEKTGHGIDVITCLWTLGEMLRTTAVEVLRLWSVVVAPGGRLLIEFKRHEIASIETIRAFDRQPGPKFAFADAQNWEDCERDFRSIIDQAGLTIISIERCFSGSKEDGYEDRIPSVKKYADRKWEKEGSDKPIHRDFLEECTKEAVAVAQTTLRAQNFQANIKGMSMVAVLQGGRLGKEVEELAGQIGNMGL